MVVSGTRTENVMHNEDNRTPAVAPEPTAERRPYRKPTLKRLGTVRELTQHHPSRNPHSK